VKIVQESWAEELKSKHGYKLIFSDVYFNDGTNVQSESPVSGAGHRYTLDQLQLFDGIGKFAEDKQLECKDDLEDWYGFSVEVLREIYEKGSKVLLSKETWESVKKVFYDTANTQDELLHKEVVFERNSAISYGLNDCYYFQHDFLYSQIVKRIYDNLGTLSELKGKMFEGKKRLGDILDFTPKGKVAIEAYDKLEHYALIGGLQGLLVECKVYRQDYNQFGDFFLLEVDVIIYDWYGADLDDFCSEDWKKDYNFPLNAFFMLQMVHNHCPFETVLKYKRCFVLKK
jgi:hypothetical protein